MANKISDDEKRWRAQSDAECMARYEEIMTDKSRRAAAVTYARQRAAELTKSANIMTRVSGGGSRATRPTSKKK